MTEAERIAKGLTEAQRRAVTRGTCAERTLSCFFARELVTGAINIGDYPHFPWKIRLTPLGLAVRRVLEEKTPRG